MIATGSLLATVTPLGENQPSRHAYPTKPRLIAPSRSILTLIVDRMSALGHKTGTIKRHEYGAVGLYAFCMDRHDALLRT